MLIQAAVAIGGIALSVPVYQLMMAKSPTLDLRLDGPELTLSRKKKPVARIDLSKPHRCAALVVFDMPAVKVFIAQGETEISFEHNTLPPERLLFIPICLAIRKNSFYGDSAYEFLPAGWRPGVSVQAGGLTEFLFAVAEFSNNNELVPLIAQRKG